MAILWNTQMVGGAGGDRFNFGGESPDKRLRKLKVAVGDWQIKAIQVTLNDGRNLQFGNADNFDAEFSFADGDVFTSLSLYQNRRLGSETRLGGIEFCARSTHNNINVFSQMCRNGVGPQVQINVESGVCVGLAVRKGSDIDALGFMFIRSNIANVEIALTQKQRCDYTLLRWKECLENKRSDLVGNMNVDDAFITELVRRKVMDSSVAQACRVERNSYKRVQCVLDHMCRRSLCNDDFVHFCVALEDTNQAHIYHKFILPVDPVEHLTTLAKQCVVCDDENPSALVPVNDSKWGHDVTKGPVSIPEVIIQDSTVEFFNENNSLTYPMNKRERGLCVIVNIKNVVGMSTRHGTDVDQRLLEQLFGKLGFEVVTHVDLVAQEILDALVEISQTQKLKEAQCFVLVVLSHGGKVKGVECVYGSDGNSIPTDDLLSPFTDRQCQSLVDKPRLVVLQACRGVYDDQRYGRTEADSAAMRTEINLPPSFADFIVAYPTQSEYSSFRDTVYGTWYINALVRVFMNHVHNKGVCAMLNKVNGMVSNWIANDSQGARKAQIAVYKSNLLREDLYFFPGIKTNHVNVD